jgi:DNA-binding SARP family transcriptional activator/tetratricopeptide (TPR) repeat protein
MSLIWGRQLMSGELEFGLLGPLVVRRNGAELPVPPGRQRALLAALLLAANRAVAADAITEVLWAEQPPRSAPVAVRNHVRRLRQALGEAGVRRIVTEPRGYRIRVADGELDLAVFERLLASARAAVQGCLWERAAGQAAAALGLWRGEPLADVHSQALTLREVPRLAELRLQAQEISVRAGLQLGAHDEVAAELARLAAAHPLREHLHALLMLALYRCGRQADALAAYQNVRRVLVHELGAEPGAELQGLHQQILAADPALSLRPPTVATAGSRDGQAHSRGARGGPAGPHAAGEEPRPGGETGDGAAGAGGPAVVARQLPAGPGQFTGRAAELAALDQMLGRAGRGEPAGTVVISAIGGTAGVGKTALAIHWAHQAAQRFPDGQLYANLRGFDPCGIPVTAAETIRGFLDALGVPPAQIPPDPDAQAGLYRSLLAGRQMLIVLDNARDEHQVRPLLPGTPGCLVLITSRSQLTGLAATNSAHLLTLDVLTPAEATAMLTARLAPPHAADPHPIAEIASLCAGLPLALAIAAARASARPGLALSALAAELRDTRLDALDTGDPAASVQAVFSWSSRQLSPPAARLFRLLGLHPGPDITAPAAASLAATSHTQARHHLAELTRAHLLTEHTPGRYTLHDLLRVYATSQAHTTDSDTDRCDATGRILDHYLHTAAHAARLLNPAKELVALAPPRPGTGPEQPADYSQALAWFEVENQVLLAAVTLAAGSGLDTHAWQLPWAISPFLQSRGHWQETAATQRTALAAATRLGDTAVQAMSGRLLANACTQLGDHDQARGRYASSLALYQRLGNRLGEAKVHQGLGLLADRQGRYADALGHAEQALRLFRAIGDKRSKAEVLNFVGWCHGHLGDYHQARAFCGQALTLCAEIGNRWLEGYTWDSLGYAEHHLGNLAEATACFQRAVSIIRESGERFYEADTLTRLGDTRHAAGELAQARDAWQQALDILDDLHHPDAGQVRAKLAG